MTGILLTGGSGQVGTALRRLPWPEGIWLDAPGRDRLDLADAASVAAALAATPYAAVISAGACTAVDRAETDVAGAWRVNALAPAVLAAESARRGIPILHLSTDYVFDGESERPYREADPVGPINVYGASKEGGEQAVRTGNARHVILRTSWLCGPHGRNFLRTMLRLAAERPELTVVADQHGRPTFAGDLALAVRSVTLTLLARGDAPTGTFHFANAGRTTWSDFAAAILAASARRGGPEAGVRPIPSSAYPVPARRPRNSQLATEKIAAAFGIVPRPWREALEETLDELIGPPAEGARP